MEADQFSEGGSVVRTVHHDTDLPHSVRLPEMHVHHWL